MSAIQKPLLFAIGIGLISLFTLSWTNPEKTAYHSKEELEFFSRSQEDLPNLYNDFFAGSGACVNCHGFDTAGVSNVNGEGMDINVVDDWRASMMANSAKDPFWRAKVSHEVLVNPAHQEALETKCTSCHAPLGNYNNVLGGDPHYSIAELEVDSIALDGVSCLACHQQVEEDLGNLFSGSLNFNESSISYGPYQSPLVSPMALETGYIPVYSEHIKDAGICAGCHSLITETVDLNGNPTGGEFVEQATYHEWLNSDYNVGGSSFATCQDCHMPKLFEPVLIANGFPTEPRSPFSLHDFEGANTFMLNLLKNNIDTLNLSASEDQFQSAIQKTEALLTSSINLSLELIDRDLDSAYFKVEIENLAGHKFPSGYPSRRAFVQFIVKDFSQDTIFKSGILDSNGYLIGYDNSYETHFDLINIEDNVQVYEMVMGDVNGDVTTVLERANTHLKDNRIPPKGFTDFHPSYDTTAVHGNALTDPNFNFSGIQGTGTDEVYYTIPIDGYEGELEVDARVYYQSVPRKFLDEMFEFASEEIELFEYLYNEENQSPFLVKSETIFTDPLGINQVKKAPFKIYPTLSQDGIFFIENLTALNDLNYEIFDLQGKKISSGKIVNNDKAEIRLIGKKGLYLIILTSNHQNWLGKVIIT